MDRVVAAWKGAGLLVPFPRFKHAMPMFAVPKPDWGIRPIIDYSPWTMYIKTPRFSLLTAGKALRQIPLGSFLIKVDLKSCFHQLKVNPAHYPFNGIFYGAKNWPLLACQWATL